MGKEKNAEFKKTLAENQWKIIFSVEIIVCVFAAVILCVREPYTYSVKAGDIVSCDYNTYVKYINRGTDGLLSVAMEAFEFSAADEEPPYQKIAFVDLSLPFGVYRVSVETEGSCSHQIEMRPFAKNNEDMFYAEGMVLKQNAAQSDYVVKLPVIDLGTYGYEFFMNSVLGETTIRQIIIEECTIWKGIAVVLILVLFLIIDLLILCVKNWQKTVSFLTDNRIPVISAVCVVTIFFFLFYKYDYFSFETNDDMFISTIPSGIYGQNYICTSYSNVLQGIFLAGLSKFIPICNWTIILYVGYVYISYIGISVWSIKSKGVLTGVCLSSLFFLTTYHSLLNNMNYSKSGGVLISVGLAIFAHYTKELRGKKNTVFLLIFGSMIFAGSLVRSASIIAALPFIMILTMDTVLRCKTGGVLRLLKRVFHG